MSPTAHRQIENFNYLLEIIYKPSMMAMMGFCFFFLHALYAEHEGLLVDSENNKKEHIGYNIDILNLKITQSEIKGDIKGLRNVQNWHNKETQDNQP